MEPAPLLSLPEAPAPAGGGAEWFTGGDGLRLRAALFRPPGEPRGSVVVSPGRAEPLEKYFEAIEDLQARGFVVLVHDWRGQGRSARMTGDSLKGHARSWRRYLADFDCLLKTFEDRLPKPWIAMGHSMGGGLTVLALSEGETRFAGAITSAAMLGPRLGGRPAAQVRLIAWLMGFLGHAGDYVYSPERRAEDERRQGEVLTHDPVRWKRYQTQVMHDHELDIGGFTWGWLAFAMTLALRVEKLRGVERIAIPLVLVGAEHDRLVANAPQRLVARRAPKGRFIQVKGAFHELLMESDDRRAVFWRAFDELAAAVAPPIQLAAEARRLSA